MKRKIFALLLCSMMLSGIISGCGTDESAADTPSSSSTVEGTTETSATQVSETEYKTIQPPEGGWTLAELNKVLYINGKNAELPFTLNELGSDFEPGEDFESDKETGETESLLKYNDEIVGGIAFVTDGSSDPYNVPLTLFAIKPYKTTIESLLVINGVRINDSYDELIKKMGQPTEEAINGITKYEYYNCGDYRVGFCISHDENTVSTIRIEKAAE